MYVETPGQLSFKGLVRIRKSNAFIGGGSSAVKGKKITERRTLLSRWDITDITDRVRARHIKDKNNISSS